MSTEELRTIASKIRREAEAAHRASPAPWTVTDEHVVRCADGMIVADRSSADHPAERADLPYIASMTPAVGEALAKLLETAAELHEPLLCDKHEGCGPMGCQWCEDEDWPCADMRNALAVARAINGGAQ